MDLIVYDQMMVIHYYIHVPKQPVSTGCPNIFLFCEVLEGLKAKSIHLKSNHNARSTQM